MGVEGKMNAKTDKGKKWAINSFWFILITQGIKILFAFGHADSAKPILEAIAAIIGLSILICPIAFTIGYFTEKSH